jgi:hypothetical protein
MDRDPQQGLAEDEIGTSVYAETGGEEEDADTTDTTDSTDLDTGDTDSTDSDSEEMSD